MINGVWAEVQLIVGPVFPQTYPVVFPVPNCIIGLDILRSLQSSHNASLTCGTRAMILVKAKSLQLSRLTHLLVM